MVYVSCIHGSALVRSSANIFWVRGVKIFWVELFWVEIRREKNLGRKFLGRKIFESKKIFGLKNFGSKKFFGSKKRTKLLKHKTTKLLKHTTTNEVAEACGVTQQTKGRTNGLVTSPLLELLHHS